MGLNHIHMVNMDNILLTTLYYKQLILLTTITIHNQEYTINKISSLVLKKYHNIKTYKVDHEVMIILNQDHYTITNIK